MQGKQTKNFIKINPMNSACKSFFKRSYKLTSKPNHFKIKRF